MNEQLLLFELSGNNFFLPANSIVQIQESLSMTYIPNGLPYLSLVTSLRGNILPIIDLKTFLEIDTIYNLDNSNKEKFIIIEYNKSNIIIRVDKVLEIIDKPNIIDLTDLHQIKTESNSNYYNSAFLYMNKTFLGINIMKIIYTAESDFKRLYLDFISRNILLYKPDKITEKQLEYNIDSRILTQPSSRLDRLRQTSRIRKKKRELNGTLIKLDDLKIIIPNDNIKEIYNTDKIIKVPNALDFILGVINYRSKIISVIDLSIIFGFTPNNSKNTTKLLIIEKGNDLYALKVDSIIKTLSYDRSFIRSILELNSQEKGYLFKSAIIDISGEIFFLLNLEYVYKLFSFSFYKNQKFKKIIYFSNPKERIISRHSFEEQHFILIKNKNNIFLLDSAKVDQILDQNSILITNYDNQILRGAVAHNNIIPLIDFNYIIKNEKTHFDSEYLTGIVVNSKHNNGENICLLVEEVLDFLSINDIRSYDRNLRFSNEILPSIYSGFCTYKESIGVVIDSNELLNDTIQQVISTFELDNIAQFETVLSPNERNELQKKIHSKKELETLLTKYDIENRFELLIIRLNDNLIGLEVDNIKKVYSSLIIEKFKEDHYPFTGLAKIESNKIPILDLNSVIISETETAIPSYDKISFSLELDNETYVIQADDIFGVFTIFKEDLNETEDLSLFKGVENIFRYSSKNKNLPTYVKIIKQDDLQTFSRKTNLKEISRKININEE